LGLAGCECGWVVVDLDFDTGSRSFRLLALHGPDAQYHGKGENTCRPKDRD
jgi:hypothetical protein